MDFKKIHESETTKKVIIGLAFLIAVLVIFQAGMEFGFRKAMHAGRFGDNFYNRFEGKKPGSMTVVSQNNFKNEYGATGKVAKITDKSFVIIENDGTEQIIVLSDEALIRRFMGEIKITDIKDDEIATVIGEPNDKGEIVAKFIRIFPKK